MNEEIIIINDEPFYKILNGTSYDYAPIPKEFKPYFEKLQQKTKQLQNNWNELKKFVEEEIKHLEKSRYVSFNEYGENKLRIFKDFQFKMQELEGKNE